MPAFTAWIGLDEIGRIAEGETVFVSGAAGAVGSAAAQIALLRGCRVIGSAGSAEKVEWLRSLGVEAFDYRTADREGGARGRHRRVLRQRRRCAARGRAHRAAHARSRRRVWRDLALQRRRGRARPAELLPGRDQAAAHPGLHHLRPQPSASRSSWPRSGLGPRREARAIARRSSTASRTCRRRSSACSTATTSARCSSASRRDELALELDHGRAEQALAGDREQADSAVRRRWNGDRPVPRGQADERLLQDEVAR